MQFSMGDIKQLDLPTTGEQFEKNQKMGFVESNNSKVLLFSPFDMTVLDVHFSYILQVETCYLAWVQAYLGLL